MPKTQPTTAVRPSDTVPRDCLFRFAPVPRHSARADGWSSDRQHAFIWALSRIPSVAAAARSVGMNARSAYRLRGAPGADEFAEAWRIAWDMGVDAICEKAIHHLDHGEAVPIVRRGKIVGKLHRVDNRLLMRALSFCDRRAARRFVKRQRADREAA